MTDSSISLLILVGYSIAVLTFLIFLLRFVLPLVFNKKNTQSNHGLENNYQGVSVIIAAKNEANNLQKHLREILEQEYPNFEVIVANDHSNDRTIEILNQFQKDYTNLNVLDIQDWHSGGKKAAITKAIFYAKNELLLFTDADCIPSSNQWIKQMTAPFEDEVGIVLGYGAYRKERGLLNLLIRFDTAEIALLSFGFAYAGNAYMGVGRNMAYRKRLFMDAKGFINHLHIPSGDDDLFVQQVASKKSVRFVMEESAKTISIPKNKLTKWWKQKRRHQTTASLYKGKFKVLLGLYALSKLVIYTLWPLAFLTSYQFAIIILFISSILIHFTTFNLAMQKIQEQRLSFGTPLYSFLLLFNTLYLGFSGFFIKEKTWK